MPGGVNGLEEKFFLKSTTGTVQTRRPRHHDGKTEPEGNVCGGAFVIALTDRYGGTYAGSSRTASSDQGRRKGPRRAVQQPGHDSSQRRRVHAALRLCVSKRAAW